MGAACFVSGYPWRAVGTDRVDVCVGRVVERGRVKCGQYWPQEVGDSDTYGRFLVKNVRVRMFQDFRLSQLQVYDSVVSRSVSLEPAPYDDTCTM